MATLLRWPLWTMLPVLAILWLALGLVWGTNAHEEEGIAFNLLKEAAIVELGMNNTESAQNFENHIETDNSPVYEVRQTSHKGLAVFATRGLPKGTKIIIEDPLVSVPVPEMVPGQGFKIVDMITNLEAAYKDLSPEQQEAYTNLHDFRFPSEESQNRLLTIFRSNAYNTGDSNVGLFPKIARINHSCRPNCGNWWSEKAEHRVIYAARDIGKGEEVTVSYIPLLKKTKERQARLAQYGFVCDCEACQSPESDKRRTKIADLLESLEQKLPPSSTRKASTHERLAKKSQKLLELVEEEGMTDYAARAFHIAAVFSLRVGNLEDAREYANKELETRRLAEDDSNDVLRTKAFIEALEGGET